MGKAGSPRVVELRRSQLISSN
ncbi:hypothetical protein RSAG8_03632, partial [Rhizoctonia solani AG-8 WAC10335]